MDCLKNEMHWREENQLNNKYSKGTTSMVGGQEEEVQVAAHPFSPQPLTQILSIFCLSLFSVTDLSQDGVRAECEGDSGGRERFRRESLFLPVKTTTTTLPSS